jgi:beta-lactamase regulating signal transducer with metallopeptidase domain
MFSLFAILEREWVSDHGLRFLFELLWQSSVACLIGLVVGRLCSGRPALNSWMLLLALMACVVWPVSCLLTRTNGWTLDQVTRGQAIGSQFAAASSELDDNNSLQLSKRDEVVEPVGGRFSIHFEPSQLLDATSPPSGAAGVFANRFQWPTFNNGDGRLTIFWNSVMVVWLSASLWQTTRIVGSLYQFLALIKLSRLVQNPALIQSLRSVCQRVGLNRIPRVVSSQNVSAPMVFSLFSATLILPSGFEHEIPEEDWDCIFAHELAHVRRGDTWSRLFTNFVLAVLPIHPLVWLLRNRFFRACEQACDDWVIASGSPPEKYASILIRWSLGSQRSVNWLLVNGMSSTADRARRILQRQPFPSAKLGLSARIVGMLIFVVCGCCLALAQNSSERPERQVLEDPHQEQQETITSISPSDDVDDRARVPGLSLEGHVMDEAGHVLPNVQLRLFGVQHVHGVAHTVSQTEISQLVTDENGAFVYKNAEWRASQFDYCTLVAKHSGRASLALMVEHHSTEVQKFAFKLSPASSLSGMVVDANDHPVANAIVSSYILPIPVDHVQSSINDQDGRFTIDDLPIVPSTPPTIFTENDGTSAIIVGGTVGIVQHPKFARGTFYFPAGTGQVKIGLRPKTKATGLVRFNSRPVANAHVEFDGEVGSDWWTRSTTDHDGRYEVSDLPWGEYKVVIKSEEHATNTFKVHSDNRKSEMTLTFCGPVL